MVSPNQQYAFTTCRVIGHCTFRLLLLRLLRLWDSCRLSVDVLVPSDFFVTLKHLTSHRRVMFKYSVLRLAGRKYSALTEHPFFPTCWIAPFNFFSSFMYLLNFYVCLYQQDSAFQKKKLFQLLTTFIRSRDYVYLH